MPPLELHYPVSPVKVIQPFGANPEYYARFLDANGVPEKGHMGLDLQASHGQPVYAPCDGDAFYTKDAHGGDGIYIRYPNNAAPEYDIILWHLCSKDDPQFHPLIPTDGSIVGVKTGQLVGFADNTGAPFESSGDHLHLGLIPTDETAAPLHSENGFGGCIDPQPFLVEPVAPVIPVVESVVKDAATITAEIAASPAPVSEKQKLLNDLKVALEALEKIL